MYFNEVNLIFSLLKLKQRKSNIRNDKQMRNMKIKPCEAFSAFVYKNNNVCVNKIPKNKTNYFPREQTLSVLLYSDKIKIKKYSYNNCIL